MWEWGGKYYSLLCTHTTTCTPTETNKEAPITYITWKLEVEKNTKKLSKNCSTFPLLFPPHLLPSFHITHTFIHLNGTISKASRDNDSNHEGEAITDVLSRILGSLGVRIYS